MTVLPIFFYVLICDGVGLMTVSINDSAYDDDANFGLRALATKQQRRGQDGVPGIELMSAGQCARSHRCVLSLKFVEERRKATADPSTASAVADSAQDDTAHFMAVCGSMTVLMMMMLISDSGP
jgi:hypothetical protein